MSNGTPTTPSMAMSPWGAYAVTPNMAMSPRGAFAVTPNMAMSPRGAFAVTPNMAMSPRGAFAVTPNMAMSPRGAFAVTPNMAQFLPGGVGAMPQGMIMLQGQPYFSLGPPILQGQPYFGLGANAAPYFSLMMLSSMMPKPLIDALLAEIDSTMPQRKTDIYYEDDDVVHVRRSGMQYTLWPPASLFWTAMGKTKTSEITKQIAEKLGGPDINELRMVLGDFLIGATMSDLVILYPEELSKENLSPNKPDS